MLFKHSSNPNLKNLKPESSDDAIKRGVMVQTAFEGTRKRTKYNVREVIETEYKAENDAYGADDYKRMKLMGYI